MRRGTQNGVQEGIEDKRVQAIYWWDVGEGVGEGEGHWQIHAGNGQSGDEVALEEGELVLTQPYQGRKVVGEVPVRDISRGSFGVVSVLWAGCTHMKALSLTPCLSANSLDLPIVFVLMRLAHRFLQSGAPLAAT